MRQDIGNYALVGRVHKGAELVNRRVESMLKRLLVIRDSGIVGSRHHALGQTVHKRILALHAQ